MRKIMSYTPQFLAWYEQNKRDLPWRETTAPYAIWLSEIILQQTRIDQGLNYYLKFIERFPSVIDFANATEDEVLKMWQGLGYYSRARNMHSTAKTIVSQFQGEFPASYKELIQLKGVGEYTAAAIASIAFNLPHAAVDGNVYRVLSRLFGIDLPIDTGQGKKAFTQLANELIDHQHPGNFNQAVMEFGAIQCTPRNPDCEICPFQQSCQAYLTDTINKLPVKKGKVKIRKRFFNYLIIINESDTFLQKRTQNDIWKNLYEFPLVETEKKQSSEEVLNRFFKDSHPASEVHITNKSNWQKQVLSHQHIFYRFIYLKITGENNIPPALVKVNKKDIFNFAVPKPIEKELEKTNWH